MTAGDSRFPLKPTDLLFSLAVTDCSYLPLPSKQLRIGARGSSSSLALSCPFVLGDWLKTGRASDLSVTTA